MKTIDSLLKQDTGSWDVEMVQGEPSLHGLRKEIDKQDRALLEILARRLSLVKTITRLKEKEHIPFRDLERERQVLEDRVARGKAAGLEPELVVGLFELIMDHCLRLQVRGSARSDRER